MKLMIVRSMPFGTESHTHVQTWSLRSPSSRMNPWLRLVGRWKTRSFNPPDFINTPANSLQLWGGYGVDIIEPEMSQGGPGLPSMGIYYSKWFTDNHSNYIPALDHHVKVPDQQMDMDPYYWIDHWPIPLTWTSMIFHPDAWSTLLRPFRSEATKMGPLTKGTRRLAYFPESYHNTQTYRNFDNADRPIDVSMTDGEKAHWISENKRRTQSRRIMSTLSRNQAVQNLARSAHPDNGRDGQIDAWDSASDTEDEEKEETPKCRRWKEIRQYLFSNRGPNELAWDSMTFEIPEWTLYRYIRDRGGLAITPIEWHDFLVFADHRGNLFQYVPTLLFLFT